MNRQLRRLTEEEHTEILRQNALKSIISRELYIAPEEIETEEIEETEPETRFRVVTHDRTDCNGEQWSDYWVEAYPDDTNPYDSNGGASVVQADIESEQEAEELAQSYMNDRADLMKKHYEE